uniref:Carboxypeptidase O n=1 Tax=Chelydra serpentina TaxID=8475 RepID=A0A8C3SQ78_CHESE
MYQIKESNSELVTQHYLGMTYENRPVYYLKISQPSDKVKKIIWMDCGIHAREWISPAFCQWFVKEILQNYKTDPKIKSFLQNLDIYILPVLNIDGYIYSWTTERLWRKSRSPHVNGTCFGTDLNRNFNGSWCSKFQVEAAEKAAVALKGKHGTNFTVGPSSLVLYKTSGSSRDWAHMIGIPFSYTFELRDKGAYGFILPPDQILPTCEETTTAVMTIIEYVNQKDAVGAGETWSCHSFSGM